MVMKSPASKRGKASRAKGQAGEREVAALFRACGYEAQRGYQARCGMTQPDVVIDGLPELWVEVKRGKAHPSIPAALRQAEADARGLAYLVFSRGDNGPWLVSMPGILPVTIESCLVSYRSRGGHSVAKWLGKHVQDRHVVQTIGEAPFYSLHVPLFFDMMRESLIGSEWSET